MFEQSIRSYGGASQNQNQQQRPYMYAGPNQSGQQCQSQVPTFESLTKKQLLNEERFPCTNSWSKYLTVGVVPATKILGEAAQGFHIEAYIDGEKTSAMPLGGIAGLAALFSTIKQIPQFARVETSPHSLIEPANNIIISTVDFAEDVCIFYPINYFFLKYN